MREYFSDLSGPGGPGLKRRLARRHYTLGFPMSFTLIIFINHFSHGRRHAI